MYYKIKGFENYIIDRNGVVYNTHNGVIKSPYENKANGYLYVDLYKGNKAHKRPIHRLIAETFTGDPSADPANTYNCRCSMRGIVNGFKKVR